VSEPFLVTRRSFLIGLNLSLGGLAIGVRPAAAVTPAKNELGPNVFLHIAGDGQVTIVCHRSEMGQGIRSTLPFVIADELGADMARVQLTQADGDAKYGDQNTDGSTSIRKQFGDLRQAGAAARMMLVAAAAKKWRVAAKTCNAHDHAVHHVPSKRSLPFAALVADAAKLPVPKKDEIVLRPIEELPHLGQKLPLLDGPAFVTGRAVYGADVKLEGMLTAVILRPPVVGGVVAKYDAARALAVPGVRKVVEMPAAKRPYAFQCWGGLAVVADNTWAAMKGRAALEVTWDDGENGVYDSEKFKDTLRDSARAPGQPYRQLGNVDSALAQAKQKVVAEYHVPHLAHIPMEPPCAVAKTTADRCEIWAPTQHPQAAKKTVAKLLGLDETAVVVHVTFLGGAFGRKSKADFPSEAAFLSRAVGAPVRVQWTREDDLRHGYYNAVNSQRLEAGLDGNGKVTSWLHRTAYPPIASTFGDVRAPGEGDLQQGVLDLAFELPNLRAEACPAPAHIRTGWYRSVYNIFHAFAVGSFVDEIAHARKIDPLDCWLDLIGRGRKLSLADLGVTNLANYGQPLAEHPVDGARLRNALERVAALSDWKHRKGRSLGIAVHRSFLSYVGCVASVVPDVRNGVKVDETWIVIDAGIIANADRVHSQMEGAVIMGISNAMFGGVTMKAGATEQSNFRDARIARITEVPRKIHVEIVASQEPPAGVGEPGVPPVGPAIANAIFALTGKRLREFPFVKALRA
jgi:isoquinoline 1-oxidoreductase subunit beta